MDRLGKFFALVKNEYIKLYKKPSTRILLVIFLAACLCFAPLMKLIDHYAIGDIDSKTTDYSEHYANSMEDKKLELENSPDIPFRDYKLELIEAFDPASDWQYRACTQGMYSDSKREIQTMTMFCKTDDWRGFMTYTANSMDASTGERWACNYRLEHNIDYSSKFDEQNKIINQIANGMNGEAFDTTGRSQQEIVMVGMYQLEHEVYEDTSYKPSSLFDITPYEHFDFWDVMIKIPYVESFIGIIMIVIAGGIVSSEFSQGTIKFLLISPAKREKILMAKYFTVISMGFLMMLVMFLINIPITGLLFSFKGITAPYISVVDGEVIAQSTFVYLIKSFMLKSVQVIISTTLAFTLSSLVRSTALAVVTGYILNSIDVALVSVMYSFNLDWGRYLIFANTDLLNIYKGTSVFPQHSLGFALIVIIAHMAVFLLTAWDSFTRRSV